MVHTFFEDRVDRLNEILGRFAKAMEQAGISYEVVGGLAVYLQVERAAPDTGRLTRDIDVLVRRDDVERIARTAEALGFMYRNAGGLDMLVDSAAPSAARAIRLVFSQEKVRAEYVEAAPEIAPERLGAAWVAPVEHLLRMKLTSYRLKDRVHVQDMDAAGLITAEMEARLQEGLRARLEEIRRTE